MTITVLSKLDFETLVKGPFLQLDDDRVERWEGVIAYICICDTHHPEDWSNIPYFQRDHLNVLRLWFDDVEEDIEASSGHAYKVFDETDAKVLLNFIDAQRFAGVQQIFVHCIAGISRSGAVGAFISDYCGGDYLVFKKQNPKIQPNATVLKVLRKVAETRKPRTFLIGDFGDHLHLPMPQLHVPVPPLTLPIVIHPKPKLWPTQQKYFTYPLPKHSKKKKSHKR